MSTEFYLHVSKEMHTKEETQSDLFKKRSQGPMCREKEVCCDYAVHRRGRSESIGLV
jgi:hypothetical protein